MAKQQNSIITNSCMKNIASKGKLNIVLALPCEARPFIDHLKLIKLATGSAFPVYKNKTDTIHLIVSGIGSIKAAAATSYLHMLTNACAHSCYLNVGIAGSEQFNIGELVLINKIIDANSQRAWYPQLIPNLAIQQFALQSFATAQTSYHRNYLQDMEAYGVVISASQLVKHEQIQVVKIISDNKQTHTDNIKPKYVTDMLMEQWESINQVINYLLRLSASEYEAQYHSKYFDDLIEKYHFTKYQQHQLLEYLRRWETNFPNDDLWQALTEVTNPKDILVILDKQLQKASY